MPKKASVLTQINDLGPKLLAMAIQASDEDLNDQCCAALRSAVYQLTIAQLHLIVPEEMGDALVLGKPRSKTPRKTEPNHEPLPPPPPTHQTTR